MAGSPFDVFRRNQRQLMVVMTGLAMFAFIFLDSVSMQSGRLPRSLGVVLVAMLCAGGMWVIGSPRGKGNELALYGALVGGVIAFFGLRASGPVAVVESSIGAFTPEDLQRFAQRRSIANRFVSAISKGTRATFGPSDQEALLQRAILLHECQERGIQVTNDAVNEYLTSITDGKLSMADYQSVLKDLGLPESELFSILREELQAQMAFQMDLPAAKRSGMGPLETPLTYWKQYKMLQVRQTLDVAAVPVEPFVAKVPEPNDAELLQFFELHKKRPPTPTGEPGFLQERKVNLGYVAAEFESFEQRVSEPTDAEVAAYYEANKQRYPVLEIPDSMGITPDLQSPGDESPASALEPANTALPPAPAEAPAADATKSPPAPSLPENGEAAAKRELVIPVRTVSFSQKTDAAADAAAPAADENVKADAPAPEPTQSEAPVEPSPKSEAPTSEAPEAPKLDLPPAPGERMPPSPAASADAQEPKYRELDEGLKLEIRETMLKERAFEAMGNAIDRAYNRMAKLADEYLGILDEKEQAEKGQAITAALKAYAEQENLIYAETGLLTRKELRSSVDHMIGLAAEPSANPFQQGVTVDQRAFDNDTIFFPNRADSQVQDRRYAYWKLADVPPREPEFAEVKDKVVAEWKIAQARPLAERRAKDLAEKVSASKESMLDLLPKETVTGAADGDRLSVRTTPPFSWLTMPRNLPFQFNPMFSPPPQLSTVEGVEQAGRDFMKAVFEEIGAGQTGVAVNESKSVYYVVHVKDRDATPAAEGDNLGLKALQQQFLTEGRGGFEQGPYMYLGREQLMELVGSWRKGYEERYSIAWMQPASEAARPE